MTSTSNTSSIMLDEKKIFVAQKMQLAKRMERILCAGTT